MTWGRTRNFRARPALRAAPALTRLMMRAAAAAVGGLAVTVAAAAAPALAVQQPGGTAASYARIATGPRTATGQMSSGAPWAHIAAGDVHACGIGAGGTLWCWGANGSGQLGTGSHASPGRPQQVMTPAPGGWLSVTAGGSQTCAIRTGGTLWCWGFNIFGELGIGNLISRIRPWQVTAPARGGWASVTAGEFQTCATRTDGTAWCWGDDIYGELGIGGGPGQDRPRQVLTPAPGGWVSITAGGFQTCAIRTGGTLWCWGYNGNGQLGIGSHTDHDLPQQVTIPAPDGWADVTSGDEQTCGIRTGGSLWCWGANEFGQLGLGCHTDQNRPHQVTSSVLGTLPRPSGPARIG